MNKLQKVVQYTAYTLIASAALAACTIVSISDSDEHTRQTYSDTTTVVGGVPVPESVQRELDASGATLTQCATESDDNCYWDAVSRGNNNGYSFIAWHGQYFYGTDHR